MEGRVPGADHRVVLLGPGGAGPQAARLLAVGLVVGLAFGAVPLRQGTDGLDWPGVTRAASAWEAMAERAGLNAPYRGLRAAIIRMRGM